MRRILIDVDQTITHTLQYWVDKINTRHGTNAQLYELDQYHFGNCEPLKHIDPNEIHEMLQEPGFIYNIPIMDGALEVIKELNDKYQVYLITAREGHVSMPDTLKWYREHFPFLKKNQLIFCEDKHLMEADVLIDDNPHIVEKYKRKWGSKSYILGVKYAYNQHLQGVDFVEYNSDTWKNLHNKLKLYEEHLRAIGQFHE